jgi:hypothetical protein
MFMTGVDSDERIAKRADNGQARRGRPAIDRSVTQNRENTDSVRRAERRAMLVDVNTLLPPIPHIPGFHGFWATTTNGKDTVENRQRLGYSFITRAELPDFCLNSQKSGELTEDRIMVNEMVAMKISQEDWEDDMMYKHYDLPSESIKNLKDSVHIGQDGRGRSVAYSGGEFSNGVADGYAMTKLNAPTLAGVR